MSLKTLMFLTSSLATASVAVVPLAAQADGMSQLGTWGKPAGMGAGVSNLTCDGVPGIGAMNIRQMNLPRTPGVNTNTSAFRPNASAAVNNNVGGNISGNIGMSKPLNVFNRNQVDNSNSGLNVDTGNANRNVDTSSATNTHGFGGGRQLNVFSSRGNDAGADNSRMWPAPGLGDTLLSYSSQSFEVDRAFVSDCRMPSDGIVEAFYIVEDVGLRLVA
jgi:hypothetical protein